MFVSSVLPVVWFGFFVWGCIIALFGVMLVCLVCAYECGVYNVWHWFGTYRFLGFRVLVSLVLWFLACILVDFGFDCCWLFVATLILFSCYLGFCLYLWFAVRYLGSFGLVLGVGALGLISRGCFVVVGVLIIEFCGFVVVVLVGFCGWAVYGICVLLLGFASYAAVVCIWVCRSWVPCFLGLFWFLCLSWIPGFSWISGFPEFRVFLGFRVFSDFGSLWLLI